MVTSTRVIVAWVRCLAIAIGIGAGFRVGEIVRNPMHTYKQRRLAGLWNHSDFMKLWVGESISLMGSQVTFLALPLTTVLFFKATPVQMGILGAAQGAPSLLVSLMAGVWVDRRRRRPIMISANVGRAVLLGSIPAIAALGRLNIGQLYVVAFLVGILTVFFDVAYMSFLPTLVTRDHLVEGNTKLTISSAVAQFVGPALGGWLVQAITAPMAIAVDAMSFVVSATFLMLIHTVELVQPRDKQDRQSNIRGEILEGLRIVWDDRILRVLTGSTGTLNFCVSMLLATAILYLTRDLGIKPVLLGLIFAFLGPGAVVGAFLTARVTRLFGVGATTVGAILLAGAADLLIPLMRGPLAVVVPVIAAAYFVIGLTGPFYTINIISLRQAITPDRLLGRVSASMRFLTASLFPLGALVGGGLGQLIGLRSTLVIGGIGVLCASLWLLLSPVRGLHESPKQVHEPTLAVP